jgi:archaellum component FlaF (FlaF/FlaG flagellin family)
VPEYQSVSVTIQRNSITADPTISAVFNGGQVLGMVQLMNVTVVRSDCITENNARKYPGMGDTITLMGTTKTDRVIVVMTMTSGGQYTIIDGLYPFPR